MSGRRVVLVPGVLALLPSYAGLSDPVAELRAACLAAVGWLAEHGPVRVVASGAQGQRVGEHLVESVGSPVGSPVDGAGSAVLVVGNGSARRSEKAPGHLDPRAAEFDDALERALRAPDVAALAALDLDLAGALLADADPIRGLGDLLADAGPALVDHADDPFGVQYWVMRWTCGS